MTSRRSFLVTTAGFALAPQFSFAKDGVPAVLDHILLGCSDLDRGIDFVEKHTGVRAAFGGVHPGRGTRNALLSFGERYYLEIIAPDPLQPAAPEHYDLQKLTEPRLVAWAAHPGNLTQFATRLRDASLAFEGPTPGSRKTPDGKLLQWKTLNLKDDHGGLLPFFIEWSADTAHPSTTARGGCHLEQFEIRTPDADALAKTTKELGLDVAIVRADRPQLRAAIKGGDQAWDITS